MKVDSDLQSMGYADEHSEDEGDFQSEDVSSNGFHTKADMRKSNKPIMEKRRRARINNCLNELKAILLEAMRKDPARHSKLEKADILELTVRHLQNVQRNQLAIAMATDPTVLHRFKNGFSECATEVGRYLGRLESVEPGVKQRLTGHLGACVNGLQQVGPMAFGSPRYSPIGGMNFPPVVPPSPATPTTHGIHPAAPQGVILMGNGMTGLISPPQSQDLNNNISRPSSLNLTANQSCSSTSSTVTSSSTPNLLNTSHSNSNSPNSSNNNLSMENSSNNSSSFELSRSHIKTKTSNTCSRMNSAFTVTMGTPPPSPPPPTQIHITSAAPLSNTDNLGTVNEKGTNTTPLFNIGGGGSRGGRGRRKSQVHVGGGLPLDFSLASISSSTNNNVGVNNINLTDSDSISPRDRYSDGMQVPKVEIENPKMNGESPSTGHKDSMWRPW